MFLLLSGKPMIPSIPKIQQLIEAAWAKGFDQQGREQLGNKVTNTTKWIDHCDILLDVKKSKAQNYYFIYLEIGLWHI